MNSIEINNYLEKLFHENDEIDFGVLSADYLCKINFNELKDKFYIVNNQPSNMPGQHWLAISKIDNNLQFFDSYGMGTTFYGKYMQKFVKSSKNVTESDRILQYQYSDTCGQFCIFYIAKRYQGCSLEDIYKHFSSNTKLNDEIVKKFVTNKNHIFHKKCISKRILLVQGCICKNKITF